MDGVGVPDAGPSRSSSFDTWPDIRRDVLDRAEQETGTDVSEFWDFVARAGDRAYQDLLSRGTWLCARARRPLILHAKAPIATTITWAAGAYAATLGAAQTEPLRGWKVKHPTRPDTYRVFSHVPGSAAVVFEAPLQGAALAAGTAITLFRDEYELAEIQGAPAAPGAVAGDPGGVDVGEHKWRQTWISANGETEGGAPTSVTIAAADKEVTLTPELGPPGTLAHGWYRTKAGGSVYYLQSIRQGNDATPFVDSVPDASLGTDLVPERNTTSAVRQIVGMWALGRGQIHGPYSDERAREENTSPPNPAWPPRSYARVNEDTVRFTEYPSEAGLVEVVHTFIARDLSVCSPWEIVIPRNWRWMLSDGTLYFLYLFTHDSRAADAAARWEKAILDFAADDEKKRTGLAGTRQGARKEPPGR